MNVAADGRDNFYEEQGTRVCGYFHSAIFRRRARDVLNQRQVGSWAITMAKQGARTSFKDSPEVWVHEVSLVARSSVLYKTPIFPTLATASIFRTRRF